MNPHNAYVRFGKYEGQRLTRVPVGYLKWAVANRCEGVVELASGAGVPLCNVAPFEIQRRGERLEDIEVSLHAIDRASLHFLPKFRLEHQTNEGLASWISRNAFDAWIRRNDLPGVEHDGDHWKISHNGIVFVFNELALPVLKTVEPV